MNLVVGVPTGGSPTAPFLESLRNLAFPPSVSGYSNISITGNFVPAQRELIVRHALRAGADFLLMIDDDIIVPSDAPASLLAVFDADERCAVAGGLYYARDGWRPMVVSNWNPKDTTLAYTPAFAHEPVLVDGVGFGCVLIKCAAFPYLTEPYFPAQVLLQEALHQARVCNEDYFFCHRVREHGFNVYLHPGVKLGHYDRARDRIFPSRWEAPEETNRPRMPVMRGDGTFALAPLDESMKRQREQHLPAHLDYIIEK